MSKNQIYIKIEKTCVICNTQFKTRQQYGNQPVVRTCSHRCARKIVDMKKISPRENLTLEEINNLPDGSCGMRLSDGSICLLDPDDYDMVGHMKWCRNGGYIKREFSIPFEKKRNVPLHLILLDVPSGMVVDHINGNRLDNRRANLRICTPSQNCMNRRLTISNKLGLKGVHFCKAKSKFKAKIVKNGISYHLGSFACKLEAKAAYDKAALALHGEFARLS